MTVRLTLVVLALITAILSGSLVQAAEDRDVILRKNGTKIVGYVETENTAGVVHRTIKPTGNAPQGKGQTLKLNELSSITYAGMNDGAWAKGQSERNAGNYEVAAEFFNQLASTGTREWEKVYGAIAEGECWELARKFGDAAKAFAVVANGYAGDPAKKIPAHRLWLDAKYRMGMAQAQAKDPAAEKTAAELEEFSKKENLSAAQSRANAIRAAIFAVEGNPTKFSEFMKKATLRSIDEPDAWFHFKLFCADSLRLSLKKSKDAAQIYREILNGLVDDPTRQAQISLGLGLTMMENDKEGALAELLKLDVLPYGSPDQKCEARFHAGRMLWESAQAIKANAEAMKDERKAAFVKETERAARLVVTAAADGPAKNPNVALAKSLLESFGADPDAQPEITPEINEEPAPSPTPEEQKETPAPDPKKEDPKKKKKR
jgi:hypothetical protein